MRLNLPFRLARGITVVFSIVIAHVVIFWLFNTMKIPMPDLPPVFATLMVEPRANPSVPPRSQDTAASAPASPSAPPSQAPSRNDGSSSGKREAIQGE